MTVQEHHPPTGIRVRARAATPAKVRVKEKAKIGSQSSQGLLTFPSAAILQAEKKTGLPAERRKPRQAAPRALHADTGTYRYAFIGAKEHAKKATIAFSCILRSLRERKQQLHKMKSLQPLEARQKQKQKGRMPWLHIWCRRWNFQASNRSKSR